MQEFDVAVIGGGPAGLAAALAARRGGAARVAILERDFRLGGILEQCIHTGFGLRRFGEELAGPEYVARFIREVEQEGITVLCNAMVLRIDSSAMILEAATSGQILHLHARAIVLAMGCRERTRFQIRIPGTRPAGVYTAGMAQRMVNVENCLVGSNVVILGSGDIGMIMARRMTLEGAKVHAVVELMPYLAGLTRNRVQCLDDFGIPLYLQHTVTAIHGQARLTGVTVAQVDEKNRPIEDTAFDIPCDTLLCSVGLIPENELSKQCGIALDPVTKGPIVDSAMQTSCPGIFACGNTVHVNDLVDNVSDESELAGLAAAQYAQNALPAGQRVTLQPGENVRYLVPQCLDTAGQSPVRAYFRVSRPAKDVTLRVLAGAHTLLERKKKRVNPGEIEFLTLDPAQIAACGAAQVCVEVTEG